MPDLPNLASLKLSSGVTNGDCSYTFLSLPSVNRFQREHSRLRCISNGQRIRCEQGGGESSGPN